MKKSTRRRPELEPLEAMLLMSTVSAEAHHAAKAVAQAGPIQMVGTFPALKSHTIPATPDSPAEPVLYGLGNLAKLGRALIIVPKNSSPSSPEDFDLFINKKGFGSFSAQISLPAKGATITTPYVSDNLGESYFPDDVNQNGTVTISDVVSKGGKSSYVLKLS
jgi:hypothetical protein